MKKEKFLQECKEITHYIFDGMTTKQIADRLCYSKSTVALRIKYLFEKYGAKNKIEFIITIFSELMKEHKQIIREKKKEIKRLNIEIASLKEEIKYFNENKKYGNLPSIKNQEKSAV